MLSELTLEEGKYLVRLARRAVQEYLRRRDKIGIPEDAPNRLRQPCGVFVTLSNIEHGEKELRGCIGYPYATEPLAKATIESAISASTQDPRFPPLSRDELDHVVFEISVLTPLQRVKVDEAKEYPAKIRIGLDGLVVERGMLKGLLLPQVPVECKWNEEEFLCQCCIKATLPADSWLLKDTKVYRFQAVILEEVEPNGEVHKKILGGD